MESYVTIYKVSFKVKKVQVWQREDGFSVEQTQRITMKLLGTSKETKTSFKSCTWTFSSKLTLYIKKTILFDIPQGLAEVTDMDYRK